MKRKSDYVLFIYLKWYTILMEKKLSISRVMGGANDDCKGFSDF